MKSLSEFIVNEALNYTQRDLVKHITKKGWTLSRNDGRHDVYSHPDYPHRIAVPKHRGSVAPGTVHDILKKAG